MGRRARFGGRTRPHGTQGTRSSRESGVHLILIGGTHSRARVDEDARCSHGRGGARDDQRRAKALVFRVDICTMLEQHRDAIDGVAFGGEVERCLAAVALLVDASALRDARRHALGVLGDYRVPDVHHRGGPPLLARRESDLCSSRR
eukprot:6856978-Prymnesium_polylepis.1